MKSLKLLFTAFLIFIGFSGQLKSHSVQIAYCVDCAGNLRIFVEHWHGTANPSSTNMTINLTVAASSTIQTNPPSFGIINVPFASLPGCATPVTAVAGCPGNQNTYNDWVIYDYTGLPTGVPISFTILSGNNSFTSDGCGMYPLTVNFVIPPALTNGTLSSVCQGAPSPAINVPAGVFWTNSNTGIGLAATGTGPIAPFTATGIGSGVISYATGCGISNNTITVVPSLTSSFNNSAGASGVCLGTAINFNNTSPSSTGWLWNFGNGSTSTAQNPSHTYALPGVYSVSLTVTNGPACPGTSVQSVTVHPFPVLAYILNPVCANVNVPLINTSNIASGTMAFAWTMTGALPNTSTATNPIFSYAAGGTYTVNLTATSNNGCVANLSRTVAITASPIANFTINYVPCSVVPTVTATSTSLLNGGSALTGFQYDWGDATPLSVVNPATHTYGTSGPKVITFTVTNAGGCRNIITQNVNITVKPAPNFTFTPLCVGSAINFTNTSTTATGVNSYTWDFGNASGSNLINNSVNYATSGTYSVTLVAQNTDMCSDSIKKLINVFGRAVIDFTPAAVCFNTPTNFINLTTTTVNANTGAVASYSWNFGATSGTSSATNPINTYTNPANATANTVYSVNLYATTANGCTDVLTKTITVYSLPTPAFISNSVCIGSANTLTDVGSNNGNPYYQFDWDFNNNNIADATTSVGTVNNVFPAAGNNLVTYTVVTSPNGGLLQCKSTATNNVWVHAGPQAIITNTNQCVGSGTIGISGITSTIAIGTITNYAWNYGNSTSSLVNPTPSTSVSYTPSGTYLVTLTVTSMVGCSNSAIKTVTAFGRSVINFGPSSVCYNTPTIFTNSTVTNVNANTSAVASWSWNFGATAGSSTLMNPTITYTNPANATANITYSATLFATTADGCKDSLTLPVIVYALPTPNFVADSVCLGNQTTLSFTGNNNGNPLTFFKWDFNNDGIVDLTNSSLTTQTVFPNFGNTAVTYTVITSPSFSLSCFDKITKNVWVHPIPVAAISHLNSCLDTQPLNMSGAPSTIAIGTVTNYAWNYGNGNTNLINTIAPTSHSFIAAGDYVVTLTVTSNAGCSNVNTTTVSVWERPYAHFSYTKTCLNKRTTLQAFQKPISGTIVSYNWDFNTNTSNIEASGAQVNYTFAAAGVNTVNLMATTDKGCTNILPGTIYINYIPKPNFYAPKRAGCADLCIAILDSSAALTGPAKNDSWQWTFGNGQNITMNNGVLAGNICYTNTSNYTVQNYSMRLILRSDSGCVDSIIKNNYITVYPNPKADFNWDGEDGTILTPQVNFVNTSQGYSAYQWYFNDGSKTDSTNRNPSHYFNTELVNTYNVFLAVRNQYGCKDTTSKLVDIGPNYTFYIPNAFTPNDDGVNDIFTGKGIGVKTYKMWIYDRWGEMVSYTEDIAKGWNGTIKGNVIDTKMDVYQYKVIVTDVTNKQHEYVGHVSLIK